MQYKGKLYGKIGRKYIQLEVDADQVDDKDAEIARLQDAADALGRYPIEMIQRRAKIEVLREVRLEIVTGWPHTEAEVAVNRIDNKIKALEEGQ